MSSLFRKCRHPLVSVFYFFAAVCFCVAVKNSIYLACSLASALLMNLLLKNWRALRSFALMIPFFLILSFFNPLVSRWGSTVLFNLFGDAAKPVTLEAVCYGLNNALMLVAVALWFLAFSAVIGSEKLTFLFGRLFPAVSIMMVMILRMIPFYRRRASDIEEGRRGLGLEKGTSFIHRFREKALVLQAVTASTLEGGRITADSMESRYWGRAKRTSFLHYSFGPADTVLLLAGIVLCAGFIFCNLHGAGVMNFYPVIELGTFRGNLYNQAGLLCDILLTVLLALFCRT